MVKLFTFISLLFLHCGWNVSAQPMGGELLEREPHYVTFYQQKVLPWWQNAVTESSFIGKGEVKIAYAYALHAHADKTIIFASGRTEYYLKYQETAYDFFNKGYNVFIYDHRGQGLSGRLLPDVQKGHVDAFSDYIDDLTLFYRKVVALKTTGKLYLVGHSMGGLVVLRTLERTTLPIKKVAVSAPMVQINFGFPQGLAYSLAWISQTACRLFSSQQFCYAPLQGPYTPMAFPDNVLSRSPVRFSHHNAMLQAQPQLQLGGPTNQWIMQSINAGKSALQAAPSVTTPTLILQAGADTVVDGFAQQRYCQMRGANCQLLTLPQARHELFIERDATRQKVLNAIWQFFQEDSP